MADDDDFGPIEYGHDDEYGAIQAPADQGPPLDWAGAKQALDELAAGVKPSTLGPGAQQALVQVLAATKGGSPVTAARMSTGNIVRKIGRATDMPNLGSAAGSAADWMNKASGGALDAANATGADMAMMGFPGASNPDARSYLNKMRSDHPIASGVSEAMGAMGTSMMLPAGRIPQMVQGGVTGYNTSNAPDMAGKATSGALGAVSAGVLPIAADLAGYAGRKALGAAGAGAQRLGKLLGYKPQAPAAAPPVDAGAERAAAMASQMDDVARANQRPDVLSQGHIEDLMATPGGESQVMSAVNDAAAGANPAARALQGPSQPSAAELEALQRLQDSNKYGFWTDSPIESSMGKKGGTVPLPAEPVPGSENIGRRLTGDRVVGPDALTNPGVRPGQDTQVMNLYDAMHMDEIPGMPHDSGAPWENWNTLHQAKGPGAKAASTFDNAMRDMDFESLDRIAKGQPGVSPPAPASVSPVDQMKQKIINAQKQNPDALAAFGVDPRKNERGFIDFAVGNLAADAGKWAAKKAGKAASPYIYRAGQAAEEAARNMATDPGALMSMMREGGELGKLAQGILLAVQAGDRSSIAAQTALLEFSPEFRQRVSQGTAAQGP